MKLITTNAAKIIGKIFFLTILTQNCYAMADKASTKISSQTIKEGDKITSEDNLDQGRDFNVLSFNADGSELMFNECFDAKLINKDAKEGEKECGVFRLNMTTKVLRRYEFPDQDEYFYSDASFSPKGNYVVMKRKPKVKLDEKLTNQEKEDLIRKSYEQIEIAIMRVDGSGFKVIKTVSGVIARPIMSNDETKIAYFRAKLRKPESKSFAAQFDIYEIDLKAKTDKLFAGPYEFFETGQMQYLKGDGEILVHAWGPLNEESRGGLSTSKYNKKYSNSSIYKISRSASGLLEPVVIDGFMNIGDPFSASGAIYFYGQEIKTGMRLSKKDAGENIITWRPSNEFADIRQISIKPNDSKVFFEYVFYEPDHFKRTSPNKSGIAYLNTKTSEWKKLEVPSVDSSKEIKVSGSMVFEIKQPNEQNNSLKKLPNFSLTNPIKLK